MKTLKRMTLIALALLLVTPLSFAETQTPQIFEDIVSLDDSVRTRLGNAMSMDSVLTELSENNDNFFGAVSLNFHEEMGMDPFAADSMEPYKEFYKKHPLDSTLVAIAIWENRSIDGLMPLRHQHEPFWSNPAQAAKMYNTMSEIDHKKAKEFFKEGIELDFNSGYPTFPEVNLNGTPADYAQKFFEIFAQAGSFAKEDVDDLETFTKEELSKNGFGDTEESQVSPEIEARVKKAFHVE